MVWFYSLLKQLHNRTYIMKKTIAHDTHFVTFNKLYQLVQISDNISVSMQNSQKVTPVTVHEWQIKYQFLHGGHGNEIRQLRKPSISASLEPLRVLHELHWKWLVDLITISVIHEKTHFNIMSLVSRFLFKKNCSTLSQKRDYFKSHILFLNMLL